jgi:hypothetical protein
MNYRASTFNYHKQCKDKDHMSSRSHSHVRDNKRRPRGLAIVCERVASHLGLKDRAEERSSSSFAGVVGHVRYLQLSALH